MSIPLRASLLAVALALPLVVTACNGGNGLDAVVPTTGTSSSTSGSTTGGPPPGLGTTGCGVNPYTTLAGNGTPGFVDGAGQSAELRSPYGVAVDAHGNVFIADSANNAVRKRDPSGNVTTLAGGGLGASTFVDGPGGATGTATFKEPAGVAVDALGNVFVADFGNNAIRKIDPANNVTTVAGGGPSAPGLNDGPGNVAQFWNPVGLALDAQGTLYVADGANNAIRKIDASGNVTTVAGGGPARNGFVDGTGGRSGTASFHFPSGLVRDGAGNLFVADTQNHAIRKIDPSGKVVTFAGAGPSSTGLTDGQGTSAVFGQLTGIAIDGAGNLYVSDTNNAIRKVDPSANVTTLAGPPCAKVDQPYGLAFQSPNLVIAVWAANSVMTVLP